MGEVYDIVGVQVSLDLYGKSVRAGFEIVKKRLSLRSEIVLTKFDCSSETTWLYFMIKKHETLFLTADENTIK